MPDITMCLSRTCSKRSSCFRYLAHPGTFQAYGHFDPETCVRHLSVLGDDNVRTLGEADAAALRAENTRDICGND